MTRKDDQRLLTIEGLKTSFHTLEGGAKAVDDVSFHLNKGETLGLVGESGCGKSVTALSIMRLIPDPPGRIERGRILFDGLDLLRLPLSRMRDIRGERISMIFQEPMTSLNPVFSIGEQISEMFFIHRGLSKRKGLDRAVELLRRVQIPDPEKRAREHPHQLSGGMRQRVMIAMALACDPEILIADEPTTALDVTIQAQIIDLMIRLKEDFGAAIMMISHNLGVIAAMAQRIVIMYAGRVVEEGPTGEVFKDPRHPYTKGLLRSIPRLGRRSGQGRQRLAEISGMVPSIFRLPQGCAFHPRCPEKGPVCLDRRPQINSLDNSRRVRCWMAGA